MSSPMTGSTKEYPPLRSIKLSRNAKIIATASSLPEYVLTNQEIIDTYDLIASDRAVQFSIGITERRKIHETTPVSTYLFEAAKKCLEKAQVDGEKVSRIIYSRLFGDHAIPATSLRILEKLGIKKGIPAMDISAACSGSAHALELALACINAGDDYVLLLAGDRTTIDKSAPIEKDTRTIFLNGDGFGAILLGKSKEDNFKCSYFYTDSDLKDVASIPFGTELLCKEQTLTPTSLNLDMPNGQLIHKTVLDSCKIISERLLKEASMTMDDIDFFITSDQTTLVWKDQLKLLGLTEEQSVSCFHKYGNTVAGMVPLNLNEAIETGKLKRGMTVMLMAHGAGASAGGFIFTY